MLLMQRRSAICRLKVLRASYLYSNVMHCPARRISGNSLGAHGRGLNLPLGLFTRSADSISIDATSLRLTGPFPALLSAEFMTKD